MFNPLTRSRIHLFVLFSMISVKLDLHHNHHRQTLYGKEMKRKMLRLSAGCVRVAAAGSSSDVWVLTEFAGAEGEACVDGRRHIGVWVKEGFELALREQGGGGQQPVVDAYADALVVHQAVGGLQDGPRARWWARRRQEVGHGGGRWIGEEGGRWRVAGRVCGAAMGKREGVAVHRGWDEGLRSTRLPVVAVPLLVARAVMLDLSGDETKCQFCSKILNINLKLH